MSAQGSLFDLPPSPDPDYVLRVVKIPVRPVSVVQHVADDVNVLHPHPPLSALERAFWQFHEANPGVYELLVRLARDLVSRGRAKLGIKMLFEVARWHAMVRTEDPTSDFKLNNNLTSRYARVIMDNEEDLAGVFDVRELRS